jgi:hypothetical protein
MLLTPGQPDSYADVKISGAYAKTFTIAGSYPAVDSSGKALAFNESIKHTDASGAIAVDSLETSGLSIQKLAPKVEMKKGVAKINAEPAMANDGKLNLTNITLDLTHEDPLLSMPKKSRILQDVKLNPVMANSLGKFASLVMSNATEASGLLDVTVLEMNQVPLGSMIREQEKAKARLAFSVRELHLDGPVPRVVAQAIQLGGKGFNGTIKDAEVDLANGETQSDVAILFQHEAEDKKTGKMVMREVPLRFAGGIGMEKLDLRDFVLEIAPELLPSQVRRYVPDKLTVPCTGTVDKFNIDIGKAIMKNAPAGILQGVTGGKDGKEGDLPIGDILKRLGGDKEKDSDAPRKR